MSTSASETDRLADQVAKAAERLGQLRARQLLRQMRVDTRNREKVRREHLRRRIEIGTAMLAAGLEECSPGQLVSWALAGRRLAVVPRPSLPESLRGPQ